MPPIEPPLNHRPRSSKVKIFKSKDKIQELMGENELCQGLLEEAVILLEWAGYQRGSANFKVSSLWNPML